MSIWWISCRRVTFCHMLAGIGTSPSITISWMHIWTADRQKIEKHQSSFKCLKSVEYSTLFCIYVIMLHNSYVQIFVQKNLDGFLSIQGL